MVFLKIDSQLMIDSIDGRIARSRFAIDLVEDTRHLTPTFCDV